MIINLEPLRSRLAVTKPSVIGAAIRIVALGGGSLTEKEMARAIGSAYLMNAEGDEIRALVQELEGK